MIYGSSAYDSILGRSNVSFKVYPQKINTVLETSDETVMYGTDRGMYSDRDTVVNISRPTGTVKSSGISGLVTKIDISGTIKARNVNAVTGNAVLSVDADTIIRADTLIGYKFYVTDTLPLEEYIVVDNTSLTVGGETTIEVNSPLSELYVGRHFTVVGAKSRIYINYNLPTFIDQFKEGKLWVVAPEVETTTTTTESGSATTESYESYSIADNTDTYIDITTALTPLSIHQYAASLNSRLLQVGREIRLVDSTNRVNLWVTLDREYKSNSLKSLVLSFQNPSTAIASQGDISVYSNGKNNLTLANVSNPLIFEQGSHFELVGDLFEPLVGFSSKNTSVDSDHWHFVDVVGDVVSGKIDSFISNNASFVTFKVKDTSNFNNPLVQLHGDLFYDAQIVFTNVENYNLRYESQVVSYTATTMTVRLKTSSMWNFTAEDLAKVSENWSWEIDANNYGYTRDITYDDFVVLNTKITSDAVRNAIILSVEDTTGIVGGDKLRISDDTFSFEINYVVSIIDATHLRISTGLSRTYYFSKNPQIEVLRDVFSNTHVHQIRNNEVENFVISAYLNNGYPSSHSHRVLPLIANVTTLINKNNRIIVAGSSSIMYRSDNNGRTWETEVDLNNWLEGSPEIEGVGDTIFYDNKLIAGSTDGNIFIEGGNGRTVVPIVAPEVLESSSSSSSSIDSSSSSSSSFSSLSSSSSSSSP